MYMCRVYSTRLQLKTNISSETRLKRANISVELKCKSPSYIFLYFKDFMKYISLHELL